MEAIKISYNWVEYKEYSQGCRWFILHIVLGE